MVNDRRRFGNLNFEKIGRDSKYGTVRFTRGRGYTLVRTPMHVYTSRQFIDIGIERERSHCVRGNSKAFLADDDELGHTGPRLCFDKVQRSYTIAFLT